MRRIARLFPAIALGCATIGLVVGSLSPPITSQAQGSDPLVLWDTVDVGGSPGWFEGVVVDCCASRYNVTFQDLYAGELGFVDGNTLLPVAERISLSAGGFDSWIAYNRYHNLAYVLQLVPRYFPTGWKEVFVHVLEDRSIINSFSVNDTWNVVSPVVDSIYGIEGIAFRQPMEEGNVHGRLIIDNTYGGNIDVVDVITDGTDLERTQRHSYRAPATSPYRDSTGNSLAIETQHETLGVDDLDSTDLVYIADLNDPGISYPRGFIQVLEISEPISDLQVTRLPDLDMNGTWPFDDGVQGLDIAGPRDLLYVATAIQSFDNGYVGEVDTTDNDIARVVDLTYFDPGYVLVDWYDPRRVFVTTFDDFDNDPNQGLYVHLIYDGSVVDTLMLVKNFDPQVSNVWGMAFDPYHRRLYVTVDSQVMVVLVNYGAELPRMVSGDGILSTGGELFAPDGSGHLALPPGALGQSTVVTYEERYSPLPTGDLRAVRFFTLTAVISGTTTPVLSTATPYTSAFWYADAERRGIVENSLALYRWDESGSQWSSEGITSTIDGTANRLAAELDQFGLFAILGETNRVFLPLVLRRY